MSPSERLTAAGVAAVLLSCTALLPVFAGQAWLAPAVGIVLLVAATGVVSRRLRVPPGLQPLLGLLVVVTYAVLLYATPTFHHLVLPGHETVATMRMMLDNAGTDLDAYAPPAPTTSALVLLVVLGVGAVAVLVDALAVVAGRAALAGLPLLLLFAVPSAVLAGGLGWFAFVMGAAGWLGLLLAEGRERVGQWGAPAALAGQPASGSGAGQGSGSGRGAGLSTGPGSGDADLARVGRRIGAAALGVAVLVPALLPGLDSRLFSGGAGTGTGQGPGDQSRTVTTYNPITRLQGDLRLPKPVEVLRYTTDDPSPDYLRMTTLGTYDGGGWRQEPLSGNARQNGVDKQISLPQGRAAETATRTVTDRISIRSLKAFWLPVPATPSKVDVRGLWMWEPRSESVFATRAGTVKLAPYTVRASRVLPDPAVLAANQTVPLPDIVKPYNARITPSKPVIDLTLRVTRGAVTPYAKALAVQSFFHDPAEHFRYDTKTAPGSSPDALQNFLTNRAGYCEQYASAMAAMLRVAGMPSRVAIGFTAGVREADGSYVVTTSQAHAWPEAWLAGAGWVRFEPTPAAVAGMSTPVYGPAVAPGQSAPSLQPDGTLAPNGLNGETAAQRAERLDAERLARNGDRAGTAAASARSGALLRALALAAGGLLLLATPALLHAWRRRRRWRAPDPHVCWDQLRSDAIDVGYRWRGADTPRGAARRLVDDRFLDAAASAAVGRLASAVERSRYGRPDVGTQPVPLQDVAIVRRALLAGASRPVRLRARLLPPSTTRWAMSAAGTATADALDAVDSVVAGTAGWVRRRVRA